MNGHIIPQQDMIELRNEDAWWLLLHPVVGGVTLPDIAVQARELVRAAHGRIRMNQVKLLLKGEDGLASRLHRQRFEEQKMVGTLLGVATRYNMQLKDPEPSAKSASAVRKHDDSEWKQVPSRQPELRPKKGSQDIKSRTGSTSQSDSSTRANPTVESRKFKLKDHTWTQPVMHHFALGQNGIHLEMDHKDGSGACKAISRYFL